MHNCHFTHLLKIMAGCFALAVIAGTAQSRADQRLGAAMSEETLLMFVGEETKVLSIASRREQSAWQSPAIARVITRDELRVKGDDTLSQALEQMPGFFMAKKERGSRPYLRGIPDSILFLYDTVPLTSSVTKSIHPIDNDLALRPIKRIEIINGPGSVLWGPDAFAGIVNLVPMTGKDLQGVESGLVYAAPGNHQGVYLNAGHDGGRWNAFLSLNGRQGDEDDRGFNVVNFWGDNQIPVAPEQRLGHGSPDSAKYFESYGNLAYSDWLAVSARFAYNEKPFTMTSNQGEIRWQERRSSPFYHLKLEAKRRIGSESAVKFTGFYSALTYDHEVIDLTRTQKENTAYGEIVYDRSLMTGTCIFTGGLSFVRKKVHNAPIWRGYLPEYLQSDNPLVFPHVDQESYDSKVWALFGQMMKTVGAFDFFAGLRHDAHMELENQTSLSAGIGWSPTRFWRYKLLYGTAYRTPFARQQYTDQDPELESIESLNLQVAWDHAQKKGFSVTGFYQQIENHVIEDLYAGLSEPNAQEIYGVEMDGYFYPFRKLKLQASVTLLENKGPQEFYRYVESVEVDPDTGDLILNYTDNQYAYDLGTDWMVSAQATWRPRKNLSVNVGARGIGPRFLLYPRDDTLEKVRAGEAWYLDASIVLYNVIKKRGDIEMSLRNLFDERGPTPGTYDLIENDPFTARILMHVRW